MAKSNFTSRFPHFGIFLVVALAIAIPLTVWSLNNVSTQTKQEAQVLNCVDTGGICFKYLCASGYHTVSGSCGVIDTVCCKKDWTPPTCSTGPNWSGILDHTDGATSVTYHFKINNICDSSWTKYKLTASVPTGWSYKYKGYSTNQPGYITASYSVDGGYTYNNNIYVTISRPSSARSGTYTITLKATTVDTYNKMPLTSTAYSTKKVSYIVVN